MTTKEEAIQTLDQNSAEWLAFVLKDNGNIVRETITGFDPVPSQENNWLYDIEQDAWSGAFITDANERFKFEIRQGENEEDFVVSILPERDEEGNLQGDAEEQPAEAQTDDQNTELREEKPMATDGNHVHDQNNPNGLHEHEELKARVEALENGVKLNEELREYSSDSDKEKENKELGEKVELQMPEEELREEKLEEELGEGKKDEEELTEPKSEEKASDEEENEIENREDKDMQEKMKAMQEELDMLRAVVKEQEEREAAEQRESVRKFCECAYKDGKVLESQFSEEALVGLFNSILELGNEHMTYGEGDDQKNMLEELKSFVTALPQQVKFGESVAGVGVASTPKSDAQSKKFSEDSNSLHNQIMKAMRDGGYKDDDYQQYRRFYRELNTSF